jgi:hypothetical protein
VLWTGTDAQFLELYRVTARRLRAEFSEIKIGGPGFGDCGKFDGVQVTPSDFCAAFLEACRREALPLDFFSWHCYTDNPPVPAARARAVRRMLDARGFNKTDSHLNEWNYLPGNSWDVLSRKAAGATRQMAVERMLGAEGGAFIVAALLELQDAPVNMANLFHGETGIFGLFTEVGAPTRNYHALLAFARLLDTPRRVRGTGGIPGKLSVAAGLGAESRSAGVLVGNLSGPRSLHLSLTGLPWEVETELEVRVVDEQRAFEPEPGAVLAGSELRLSLRAPAVALVVLSARDGS